MGKFNASHGSRKSTNTLKGKGSRFKPSGNSRVPLAKSMEVVAELLSSQVVVNIENGMQGGVVQICIGVLIGKSEKTFERI